MPITMQVETITPERARDYMIQNKDNYRKINRAKVRAYAEDMRNGGWELNGEPIIFSDTGILKNGQHRIAAIVLAGIGVKMAVVRGVKNDVQIYDMGMNRTTAQIVKANDIDLPPQAISAAKIIVNQFAPARKGIELNYIKKNQGELARAYRCSSLGKGKCSKKASLVAVTYLLLRSDEIPFYDIEVFFKVFHTGKTVGTDGYEPSSALVARRMFEERFETSNGTFSQKEQMEILLLALDDFHNGVYVTENYKIQMPFRWQELMKKVRKMDGLE